MITVAAHQPDLLPYSGFWYKMACADLFEVKPFDQFVKSGYQRRVKMRGEWASVPTSLPSSTSLIAEARIDPRTAPKGLQNLIIGRYGKDVASKRLAPIMDLIGGLHTDRLWLFNFNLIIGVRDLFGITTPITISTAQPFPGPAGLAELLTRYGDETTYLSGTGGRSYMGDCQDFTDRNIKVRWSEHVPVTGDSILSVLVDYDDPMEIILNTTAIEERESA